MKLMVNCLILYGISTNLSRGGKRVLVMLRKKIS